jgi:hypothetical protein
MTHGDTRKSSITPLIEVLDIKMQQNMSNESKNKQKVYLDLFLKLTYLHKKITEFSACLPYRVQMKLVQ